MTFRLEDYDSRAAQWLAARKYMAALPPRPLDRLPKRQTWS